MTGLAMLVIAAVAYWYAMRAARGGNQSTDPTPNQTIEPTTVREGAVVPVVYGRTRVPGNLIYYGNLETTAIQETVGSGKSKETVTVGYKYYMDIWQAICIGKVTLIDTYLQGKDDAVKASNTIWNDGTMSTFPSTWGLEYANRIPGVAHIAYDRMFLGENVSQVPSVHFVVDRVLPTTINHANMSNGNNPAAVIYDILTDPFFGMKASMSKINKTTFNAAANYWYAKNYGVNLVIASQEKGESLINKIIGWVGGVFYMDFDGKYCIGAFDPSAPAEVDLTEDDFATFGLSRKSWRDTYNDFRGRCVAEDRNFCDCILALRDPANLALQDGEPAQRTVDLTGFRDMDAASERLWEVMRSGSYPGLTLDFSLNQSKSGVIHAGSVIGVSHSDYGMVDAKFRVASVEIEESDKLELKYKAEQMVETLFDTHFESTGGVYFVPPDYTVEDLEHVRVFEMPYRHDLGHSSRFLLLAARKKNIEEGFHVYVSPSGTDYIYYGPRRTFSQRGTLDEEYPDSTLSIDDDQGILYTPYKFHPSFSTVSRTELFMEMRFVIIGSEIIGFEKVAPEGESSYRLKGCIRGMFNTPVQTHAASTEIWLTEPGDNFLGEMTSSDFYVKMLPFFGSNMAAIETAEVVHVTVTNKARTPWPPCRIEAVRTGASVAIKWWPTDQDHTGAGVYAGDMQTDQDPFLYTGDFEAWKGAGSHEFIDGVTKNISDATAFTFYVRARYSGKVSDTVSVYVNTSDGTYIGPDA